MVATYLVQRSGTSKANKTSIDTDYKAVLDTLVGDLLTVLYRPEWPAASLFLNVISRLMVRLASACVLMKDERGRRSQIQCRLCS
jgi:cohesin loading factor subunit SCC2